MDFERDCSLRALNTMRLASRAEYFAVAHSVEEVIEAVEFSRASGVPLTPLGDGSNCVPRRRVLGLVLQLALPGAPARCADCKDEERPLIEFGGGENWHRSVRRCLDQGWHGLEPLALIPGRVGAAPTQNIAAYGAELSEFVEDLDVVDSASGEQLRLSAQDCCFAYRDSLFKRNDKPPLIICKLRLRLFSRPQLELSHQELRAELNMHEPSPRALFEAVVRLRRRKLPDPRKQPNVGSFFKNPTIAQRRFEELRNDYPNIVAWPQVDGRIKLSAAWMLQVAGWRGARRGALGMSARHALVMVNYGEACGEQALEFAHILRENIASRFGVSLEMEPCLI